MKQQRGVTLIEMMISLLLGLSLLAGISQLFVQSQKSSKIQRALSYMMEDGRYVLEIMSKELRRTGYLRNSAELSRSQLFINNGAYDNVLGSGIGFANNEIIHGKSLDGELPQDYFVIRYQLNDAEDLGSSEPNNSNSPCTRDVTLEDNEDPAQDPHIVSIYFFVENDDNATPVLYCEANRATLSFEFDQPSISCQKPSANCTASKLPIISNVAQLVVKYGVDYYGDAEHPYADGAADYYVEADAVGDGNWKRVVSAKVFVVLRSEEDNLLAQNATYSIENRVYNAPDKRIYRVFSTTVTFRNNLQAS